MKILIITDNEFLYKNILLIIDAQRLKILHDFQFNFSCNNKYFCDRYKDDKTFSPINVNNIHILADIIKNFELVISLHCKQFFPLELINKIRCVNIHPGFNPYNRGWFPQVFSIINKKPIGVTIHEIDEMLDHGNIIIQEMVNLDIWDTSESLYHKILKLEVRLLNQYIQNIFYHGFCSLILEKLSDGELSWSDSTAIAEYYYKNLYIKPQ